MIMRKWWEKWMMKNNASKKGLKLTLAVFWTISPLDPEVEGSSWRSAACLRRKEKKKSISVTAAVILFSEAVIAIYYRLKQAKIQALKVLLLLLQLQLHQGTCACKAGILKFFDKFILVAALVFSSDIRFGYIRSLLLLSLAFSLGLWLAGALAVCVWPHHLKRQTSISCWQKNSVFCCPR